MYCIIVIALYILVCRLPIRYVVYATYFIKCACCLIVGIFWSLEFCAISYVYVFILKEKLLTITESIHYTMRQDFTSAGLFSNTDEETWFHASKPFDSGLCNKPETVMFLTTTKGKDSTNKYSQSSRTSCVLVYPAWLLIQSDLALSFSAFVIGTKPVIGHLETL